MQKYLRILKSVSLIIMLAAAFSRPGQASEQIVLTSDQSKLIRLTEVPATIVVGNPSIADVTTDGKMMFFHPRGFGVTNVLVLDSQGKKLGDYLVHIIYEDSYSVAMYGPAGRTTYSCRKDCEPVMRIGDGAGFFDTYQAQTRDKNSLAASQALGEELFMARQSNQSYVVTLPSNPQ